MSDIDVSNDGQGHGKSVQGASVILKQGDAGFLEEGSKEEEI